MLPWRVLSIKWWFTTSTILLSISHPEIHNFPVLPGSDPSLPLSIAYWLGPIFSYVLILIFSIYKKINISYWFFYWCSIDIFLDFFIDLKYWFFWWKILIIYWFLYWFFLCSFWLKKHSFCDSFCRNRTLEKVKLWLAEEGPGMWPNHMWMWMFCLDAWKSTRTWWQTWVPMSTYPGVMLQTHRLCWTIWPCGKISWKWSHQEKFLQGLWGKACCLCWLPIHLSILENFQGMCGATWKWGG